LFILLGDRANGAQFDGLGVEWACTLLGCVAAVMVPIPLVLYVYGARIRGKSQLDV
jgi:DHA1 family multidrug resistance protein-like MFS transporter